MQVLPDRPAHRARDADVVLDPAPPPLDRLPEHAPGIVRSGATLEAVEDSGFVALGLQLAEEPGAGVRERLVVEIDGIGEDADLAWIDAEGAGEIARHALDQSLHAIRRSVGADSSSSS